MEGDRFDWADLYAGNRFFFPVSEALLLLAGRAAGLREGMTVLELACGNGAVSLFFAEEFHVYARGLDACARHIHCALGRAEKSPARHRLRFLHEDPIHPDAGHGPVDVICALHRWSPATLALLRPGGRLLVGRFKALQDPVPPEVLESFDLQEGVALDQPLLRLEAGPLEWERFFRPQERVLAAHREQLRADASRSPIAELAERRIDAFRSHSSRLAYELVVYATPEAPEESAGGGTADRSPPPSESH